MEALGVVGLEVLRGKDDTKETLGDMRVLKDQSTILKCLTLELPWKDNEVGVSCIPKGVYTCKKVDGTHNIPYQHISIENVPGRSGVCIHRGNLYTQILGCILVGDKYADINGDKEMDVTGSTPTYEKLMALLPNEFKLTII